MSVSEKSFGEDSLAALNEAPPSPCGRNLTLIVDLDTISEGELNNFFCNMPGGLYRDDPAFTSLWRDEETFLQAWMRLERSRKRDLNFTDLEGYSARKLNQRPDQFFRAIDSAIGECGVNIEQLRAVVLRHLEASDPSQKRMEIIQGIHSMLLPVYKRLRQIGYTHRDLVG